VACLHTRVDLSIAHFIGQSDPIDQGSFREKAQKHQKHKNTRFFAKSTFTNQGPGAYPGGMFARQGRSVDCTFYRPIGPHWQKLILQKSAFCVYIYMYGEGLAPFRGSAQGSQMISSMGGHIPYCYPAPSGYTCNITCSLYRQHFKICMGDHDPKGTPLG
jgi:hypothetical protein